MAVELRILVDDTGKVAVHGPLENKLLCYGLLEVARDAIQDHHEQAKRIVQPAPAGVIAQFGNGGQRKG